MNIFNNKTPKTGEVFNTLLKHKNIKIIQIVSSENFDSIEYCQDEDEWVVLLDGEVTLRVEDREINLIKGESLFIPAKTTHQILEMKHGTVWLAVHIY